ncbi:serine/threonine-protein kinase HAL4/sat4 [Cladochytrium tenue]|nr:serine/threonine-protein kinase HAL4/sat4 [Cladochytrium tenue]
MNSPSPPSSPPLANSSVATPTSILRKQPSKKLAGLASPKLGLYTNIKKILRPSSIPPRSPSSPLSDVSDSSTRSGVSSNRDSSPEPVAPKRAPLSEHSTRVASTPVLPQLIVEPVGAYVSSNLAGSGAKRYSVGPPAMHHSAQYASMASATSSLRRHVSLPTSSLLERYGPKCALLGSGSCSDTFVVTRPLDNKSFAIKEFKPKARGQSDADYIKKLTAEFYIGSLLHHPNVIETVDLIIDPDHHAFEVMELCENGDLFDEIANAKMTPAEVDCCFAQMIHGVSYMHSVGVCHRDLKPENLLFDSSNRLKIIDFGSAEVIVKKTKRPKVVIHEDAYGCTSASVSPVAVEFPPRPMDGFEVLSTLEDPLPLERCNSPVSKQLMEMVRVFGDGMKERRSISEPGSNPSASSSSAKKSEGLCGTGPYMAPEEFLGRPYDGRKMYSRFPWEQAVLADPNYSKYIHHPSGRPWSAFFDNLPEGARALVARMLDPNPENRPFVSEILNDPWFASIYCCCDDDAESSSFSALSSVPTVTAKPTDSGSAAPSATTLAPLPPLTAPETAYTARVVAAVLPPSAVAVDAAGLEPVVGSDVAAGRGSGVTTSCGGEAPPPQTRSQRPLHHHGKMKTLLRQSMRRAAAVQEAEVVASPTSATAESDPPVSPSTSFLSR